MVSKKIAQALAGSSVIRAMFNEGKEMAARYGAENVYDFSLGNPATPAPESVNRSIKEIVDEMDPLELHGYMSNSGYEDVRRAMAENLNRRFQTSFDAHTPSGYSAILVLLRQWKSTRWHLRRKKSAKGSTLLAAKSYFISLYA